MVSQHLRRACANLFRERSPRCSRISSARGAGCAGFEPLWRGCRQARRVIPRQGLRYGCSASNDALNLHDPVRTRRIRRTDTGGQHRRAESVPRAECVHTNKAVLAPRRQRVAHSMVGCGEADLSRLASGLRVWADSRACLSVRYGLVRSSGGATGTNSADRDATSRSRATDCGWSIRIRRFRKIPSHSSTRCATAGCGENTWRRFSRPHAFA